MTDDLIEFLRARLDEDRLTVREANTSPEMVTGIPRSYAEAPVAIHIARFANPDRVLREIEAKREIVEDCENIIGGWNEESVKAFAMDMLRNLAKVYNDHPDYRPEWTPAP